MCEVAKEDFNKLYQEFINKKELKNLKTLWKNKKYFDKN